MGKQSIVVLTGAGISAPSGISTFRDSGGIWNKFSVEDLATPEGFARNPDAVYDFYNTRRRQALEAKPNPAHTALAELERNWAGDFLLVTQNVDGLHEAGGSKNIRHMHGDLNSALCCACDSRSSWISDLNSGSICPKCSESGFMRLGVVWFGEMPIHMDEIETALVQVDLFVSIGTSGTVYPAAGFALQAKLGGARTVELNLKGSPSDKDTFDEVIEGDAIESVPEFVKRTIATLR